MSGIFLDAKHIAVATGLGTLPGLLFGAITLDAVLPLISLMGSATIAFVYVLRAPGDADARRQMAFVVGQLQYANQRVTDLEKELGEADELNRQLRRQLARCYDTITRAGIVIVTPDPDVPPPQAPKAP